MEISIEDYNYLKIQEARLEQLEVNGVDNWGNYGCNCYELDEDECIFCTEDEVKFLSLGVVEEKYFKECNDCRYWFGKTCMHCEDAGMFMKKRVENG